MKTDPTATAGRAFVRSLNILLKFARLYGYDHVRTSEQLNIAWEELKAAMPFGAGGGLLLGATGTQLLLDGVPLESTPAEKQFAQLLSAAGLASIQFYACIEEHELATFVRAFPTGKAKPSELAQQLKLAIQHGKGISVNEICFVATDARLKDTSMAAQIAAASMGENQDSFKRMLNDPQKLLELITAAEGSKTGGTGEGTGTRTGTGMSGSGRAYGPGGSGTGVTGGDGLGTGYGPGGSSGSGYGGGGAYEGAGGNGGAGAGGGTGSAAGTGSGSGGGTGSEGAGTTGGSAYSGASIGVVTGGTDVGVPGLVSGYGPAGTGVGGGAGATGPGLGAGGIGGGAGGGSGVASQGGAGGSGAIARHGGAGGIGLGFGSAEGRGILGGDPTDEEILAILKALTTFGKMGTTQNTAATMFELQDQVQTMPGRAQDLLRSALAGMAEQGKDKKFDQGMLVQLAEHLSIKFALEQFERGDVKVNAVRQMLDRMNQEIEALRKILGQHEDKLAEAGIISETHREILDRQFWASVPESAKRDVLLSEEAWCIPPKNVQSFVSELMEHGDVAEAISVLQNYARCADSEDPDARKRTATGLSELAELYAQADPRLLAEALRHVGLRLSVEQDQDLQSLVSAAFVRLSQEAAAKRCFPAMEQALDLLAGVESQRPGVVKTLRAKLGIEDRVPEFVDEALRVRQISAGLTGVLKQLPQTAMEQLAMRFNRCQLRDDLENVINLAHDLGEEAVQYVRTTVRGGVHAEAVEMVGLLVRLDPTAARVYLPNRIKEFPRTAQDRMVRQMAACGGPGRCGILVAVLDHVDPLVMPLVVDEIGMTEDREGLGRLLTLADGDLPSGAAPYLRVKAIEALGRLRATESVNALKRILDSRKMFGWTHAQELRIAALQALIMLEPEWSKEYLPLSGIEPDDLQLAPLAVPRNSKFVRNRRHTRVRLQRAVPAVSTNLKQNCRLDIKTASLSGGVASTNMHLAPGTQVQLRMQLGLRNVHATALMRDYRAQDMAFEIVDMQLDERAKFRKILLENLSKGAGELEK
jgi:hypothetical protein